MEQNNKTSSVCREFYEKFPTCGKRVHKELVSFLMNHPSSRKKLEEWILSADETERKDLQSSVDYDDPLVSEGGKAADTPPINPLGSSSFSKCDTKSTKERELGNDYFKKKNLVKSLGHYNQAVKFACFPKSQQRDANNDDKNCLAIALANRSAVYYELGATYYDKALRDIDLAIKYGYPERLKSKLLLRKASIFAKLGNCQLVQECLEIVKADKLQRSHVKSTGNTTEDEKIKKLEMQIKKLQNADPDPVALAVAHSDEKALDHSCSEIRENFSENVNFENASDHISIRTSDGLGRHVIALNDLQEGDVLFKEQPFASVLLPEFYDSHCHHCHKPLCGAAGGAGGDGYYFPCSRCTQVLFCDDRCADAAEFYHVHECGWLNLLHSVGIAHLAIRIVLVAGREIVLDCSRNHSSLSDLTNLEIFRKGASNYQRVYSLVDHVGDMFEEDLFQYSLTAGLLTRFLITKTTFLSDLSEESQLEIGGALLRHICQLICNAHAVTDILPDVSEPSLVIDEYQKRIATAIFPAASIMNHSCDSNIMFYFVNGKQLIVKGARTIKKGENVYNCYGPHFRRMSRPERQEILLQQYFFTCDCAKCDQELQDGISFSDQFQALKCDSCEQPMHLSKATSVKCSKCGIVNNMKVKVEMLTTVCDLQRKGEYLLAEGRIVEAAEVFQSCYEFASKILYKYNSQLGKLSDSLARCSVSTGKLKEAKDLLEKSLEYVEVRFGKTSVEYIKESQKYREVCAEC